MINIVFATLANRPLFSLASLKKCELPGTLPWRTVAISSFIAYILLCSFFRMHRRDAMLKKFGYTNKQSFSKMTNVDAQAIISYLGQLEFPWLYIASAQFALFKVGILSMLE